jgi:hypothetical protein
MDIDVIGAPFDDDETIENWENDEVERRMRMGRDPDFDYMNRDPRHPERYPMGSGGEVNYGLRVRETVNPKHTSRETFMRIPSGGTRARLHAQVGFESNAPARLAYGYYDASEEAEVLASLGFMGHSGMGDDDAVFGAEAMKTIFVEAEGIGDLGGIGYIGSDDYGYADAIADDFVETFLTPRYDGMAPRPQVLAKIGYLCGDYEIGDIGKALLPKKIKLPDIGKAVGKVVKAIPGAQKVVDAMNKGYQKFAGAVDINKKKKNQMIADCNQIKASIAGMKARKPKNPKSISKVAELEKQYVVLAAEAAKHKVRCEKDEKTQLDTKAAGVATAAVIAQKVKTNPPSSASTQDAVAKLKDLGYSDEEIGLSYLGLAGIDDAIIISAVVIGAAVALGVVLTNYLKKTGKLKTDCKTTETELNKLEEDWTAGEKVPFDPATQPYTEIIKDPDTGKVLGIRAGDTLKMSKDTDTREITKAKEVATEQKGAASFTVDPETGMVTGGSTGVPAIDKAKAELVAAKAEAEQGTLLGKLGIGKIPWYAWVGVAAAGGAVIYVLAMSSKKKKATQPGAIQ